MFGVGPATRIYLAAGATDMRKGFEGLYGLVRDRLLCEPLSGHLFLFCNAQRNRLKILAWDGTGLWVCAKRLEKGKFRWPEVRGDQNKVQLSHEELALLLGGIDLRQTERRRWRRWSSTLGSCSPEYHLSRPLQLLSQRLHDRTLCLVAGFALIVMRVTERTGYLGMTQQSFHVEDVDSFGVRHDSGTCMTQYVYMPAGFRDRFFPVGASRSRCLLRVVVEQTRYSLTSDMSGTLLSREDIGVAGTLLSLN